MSPAEYHVTESEPADIKIPAKGARTILVACVPVPFDICGPCRMCLGPAHRCIRARRSHSVSRRGGDGRDDGSGGDDGGDGPPGPSRAEALIAAARSFGVTFVKLQGRVWARWPSERPGVGAMLEPLFVALHDDIAALAPDVATPAVLVNVLEAGGRA